MKFDLVDCRDDSGFCDDSLQGMWLEVRDADRGHSSLVPETDQGTPAVDILVSGWTRPVDQIENQCIDTKLVYGRVEGAKRFVETLNIILQLCCQIEVLPIVLSNCLPHGALVLVSGRRVNENVPLVVSAQHGRFSLVLSHLKDAQAQLGNRRAIVQRDCGNVTAHVILLICASSMVRLQVLSGRGRRPRTASLLLVCSPVPREASGSRICQARRRGRLSCSPAIHFIVTTRFRPGSTKRGPRTYVVDRVRPGGPMPERPPRPGGSAVGSWQHGPG